LDELLYIYILFGIINRFSKNTYRIRGVKYVNCTKTGLTDRDDFTKVVNYWASKFERKKLNTLRNAKYKYREINLN